MRVTLLSVTDSAGQNFLLADAMRKFLGYDAKSFSLANTYLDYRTDGIITEENVDDIKDFAKGSDLFIFQDILFKVPGFRIDKMANKNNTIIYGLGTPMRRNLPAIMDYVSVGWHVLPPLSDPTITRYIGGAPFEAVIVDPLVWAVKHNRRDDGIITICHAPTKTEKGEELFTKLTTEVENVEWLVVKNKAWIDAIKIKAKAHIMLDSISDESYGLNCLEGLVMGQTVISSIAPWCYCLNPDLPMTSIWKNSNDEIVEKIKEAANIQKSKQVDNRDWVEKTFSQLSQALKWEQYIKWVLNG